MSPLLYRLSYGPFCIFVLGSSLSQAVASFNLEFVNGWAKDGQNLHSPDLTRLRGEEYLFQFPLLRDCVRNHRPIERLKTLVKNTL
ncbi:MAG TPA: hypothetical protein ACFYD2_05860 [Candidatus Avalokitesvara rifleensis]|uniref:hypothetical protein n=1 Tax=Candidatus Avalokitesvara rifleensis TaxID=3367620 RepID=UPI0027128265|nr:hypothetical protein [Candidatus Brocadiales bacterium]